MQLGLLVSLTTDLPEVPGSSPGAANFFDQMVRGSSPGAAEIFFVHKVFALMDYKAY